MELVVALCCEEHVHLVGGLLSLGEILIAVGAIVAVVFGLFHHYVHMVMGLLLHHRLGLKLGGDVGVSLALGQYALALIENVRARLGSHWLGYLCLGPRQDYMNVVDKRIG